MLKLNLVKAEQEVIKNKDRARRMREEERRKAIQQQEAERKEASQGSGSKLPLIILALFITALIWFFINQSG